MSRSSPLRATLAARHVLVLVLAATLAACSASKLDRAIAAFDSAALLPAAFNLPADQQRCAAEGFRGVSTALRAFKADPSGGKWQAVTAAVSAFDSSQCLRDARLVAVLRVAQRILQSIEPTPTLAAEGERLPAYPDFKHVREEDLKELERLAKGK